MNDDRMTCAEAREQLRSDLAGDLEEAAKAALEAHLETCDSCRAAREELRPVMAQLERDLAELLRREPRSRQRILAALPRPRRRLRSRIAALAAAALLCLGVYWGLSQAPPPAAAVLQDGTRLFGSPDARWSETGPRKLRLDAGELFLRVAPAPSSFEVHTPAATAIARGTEFFVRIERKEEPMRKAAVLVTVLAGLVELRNPQGAAAGTRGESLWAQEGDAPRKQVENLALRFAKHYQPVKTKADPKIPAYNLPLDLGQVANWDAVSKKLGVGDEPSLTANGFVVLPGRGNEDIVKVYEDLKKRGIPVFVTADTLLHLYHVQFDETLKEIEEREFYPDVVSLIDSLLTGLARWEGPVDAEAHKKALTYVAIAHRLLRPEAAFPPGVDEAAVEQVIEQARRHEGFWGGPDWPLFRYEEDFSQYVPRGHYTRSEELKKYFLGMMWLGRMTFLLKGGEPYGRGDEPFLVPAKEAAAQTIAAALIAKLLEDGVLADGRKARDVWERIYAVTSFYVGLADDLGLAQYAAALRKVCGAAMDVAALSNPEKLREFQQELARFGPPAIYSGTGAQGTWDPDAGPEKLLQALHKSTGFRFMGQRYVPDSYILGKLVFPTVGRATRGGMFTLVKTNLGPIRGFPRGLDVMALLGSQRAREILKELGDDAYAAGGKGLSYDEALAALRKEFGRLTEADWNRNLYWSWLHALKPLLAEYGTGYPTFMTTQAYRTKSLHTALASWAQLRHDTILYAKQSYTPWGRGMPEPPRPVQGYVEPIPEFYGRLLALARMTNRGLTEMKVLSPEAAKRLAEFEKLLERLLAISEKELANEELAESDYEFIRNFGAALQKAAVAPNEKRIAQLREEIQAAQAAGQWDRVAELDQEIEAEGEGAMKTTLIADVHTDQNSEQVLEEGTGYVDLGVFVYRQPDGRLAVGAGPVLSYYEFRHPMKDRLTDEKWREMLKGSAPPRPEWTRPYVSVKATYQCRE